MNKADRMRQDFVDELVEFYHPDDPHLGCGSNFSDHVVALPHPFTGEIVNYDTSEHRFQAMKAVAEKAHDFVAMAPDPGEAKIRGRTIILRDGWGSNYGDLCWYVMFEVVLAKFLQHRAIREELLATGEAMIWEDSPTDDIWGIRHGRDYRGKNLLGRCLMDVREILR